MRGSTARHQPCVVEGCDRDRYAKGYCNAHYRRLWRTGDPGPAEIRTKDPGRCSFLGCQRDKSCKGLCATHYAQQARGRPLTPINERIPAWARDEAGRKRCVQCKEWKDLDGFAVNSGTRDGLKTRCRHCERDRLVSQRYGISAAEYWRLHTAQQGRCAICGEGSKDPNGRELAVDHDRSCCPSDKACGQCVRGLLCSTCNMGIGLLRDSPTVLAAAIKYLS